MAIIFNRSRLIVLIIITYIILIFGWWAILLFKQNSEIFQSKITLLKIEKSTDEVVYNDEKIKETTTYQVSYQEYIMRQWMVFGEAIFFILSLIIGISILSKGVKNQLNSANQQRNFLLSITHELKSPLSSIRLGAQTITQRNLSAEKMKEVAKHINNENEHLNSLVNNLLIAAKLESLYESEFVNIEMTQFVESILEEAQTLYSDMDISIHIPRETFYAEIDSMGIEHAIKNLVENAYKYSPNKKEIVVTLGHREEDWFLVVSDQGIGIPEQERMNVLKKFYRIGSEDTRKTKGTGIGLYIIHTVVQQHRGEIHIGENHPNGTKIFISIPKRQTAEYADITS